MLYVFNRDLSETKKERVEKRGLLAFHAHPTGRC